MNSIVVSVLGHDRSGIIAAVTGRLQAIGVNFEDSSMTLLHGAFCWMLVCTGDATVEDVEAALADLNSRENLTIAVYPSPSRGPVETQSRPYVVTVHGADRTGILAAVSEELAGVGINITDLTTRLVNGLFVVAAEVDLPAVIDADALATELGRVGAVYGVKVTLRPTETDLL